jgi:hypothetical protein
MALESTLETIRRIDREICMRRVQRTQMNVARNVTRTLALPTTADCVHAIVNGEPIAFHRGAAIEQIID